MDFYKLDRTLPSLLNAAETFELTDQIVSLARPVVGNDADFLNAVWNDLQQANEQLGAAIGREKGASPLTEIRTRLEEERDRAFSQLLRRLALTLDDPEEAPGQIEAAVLIDEILGNHPRDLHRLSDAKNTAELKVLLPKLRGADAATALQQLGLTKYVDRLESANNAYCDAVEQGAKAERAKDDIPTINEAERHVRWFAGVFLHALNYRAFQGDAPTTELVKEIGVASSKINTSALSRRTRAQSNEPQQEGSVATAG
ncbi:MAG: hypothetical protein KDB27_05705 [Planctomycetales bacterium]|nr:hypothetical protein [Planctomycetales bacterium]